MIPFVVLALLSNGVLMKPSIFGDAPLTQFLSLGAKANEFTAMPEMKVMSRWWDGRGSRDVDYAVWLNPSSISSWFGYMADKDGWGDEELSKRWLACKENYGGKLAFVFRVTALPKMPGLLDTEEAPGHNDGEDISAVRAFVRYQNANKKLKIVDLDLHEIDSRQCVSYEEALNFPWYAIDPSLAPRLYTLQDPVYPVGECHAKTFFAQATMPPDIGAKFEIIVQSLKKTRKVPFSFLGR